ncbi:MAG: PdxA family dehydrogenase [Propylenella sp.]
MTKLVAIMLGDRYGVGPELVARLLPTLRSGELRYVVVGDSRVFAHGRRITGEVSAFPTVASIDSARDDGSTWIFLDRPFDAEVSPLGRVSKEAGREVLGNLAFLLDASRDGHIDGIVYAPLNKQAMRLAGHAAGDELDFVVRHLGLERGYGEVNILGDLWTSRVTSHVPLRAVGDLITTESVVAAIKLIASALGRAGKRAPRIAVAALNPHAGEGGAFGCEEIDVIAPAIEQAKALGCDAAGPFPSDTVFLRALNGGFDAVVTMFHDQGQIALKLLGLGKGITLLAGLPLPIATPGHGTAYDIAGTGKARVDGLAAATDLVTRMVLS